MSTMNEKWGPTPRWSAGRGSLYHLGRRQLNVIEATEADKADVRFRIEASRFDRPSNWTPRPIMGRDTKRPSRLRRLLGLA